MHKSGVSDADQLSGEKGCRKRQYSPRTSDATICANTSIWNELATTAAIFWLVGVTSLSPHSSLWRGSMRLGLGRQMKPAGFGRG